ncbi:MAG: hypothetical protein ACM687_15725 [Bacteroidales bacterium]
MGRKFRKMRSRRVKEVADSFCIVFAGGTVGDGAVSGSGRCPGAGYRTGITLESGGPVHQKIRGLAWAGVLPLCSLWTPYPQRGEISGQTDGKGRRPDSEEGPEGDVCPVPASGKGFAALIRNFG